MTVKTLTLTLPSLHNKQQVIATSKARFNIAACGTKFGKTLGCSCWIIKGALEKPGSVWRWVAPIYPQAEIGFRLVKKMLPVQHIRPNETKLFIELSNGSRIEFKSGERPETLEGEGVSGSVLDEFAKNRDPKAVWESNLTTLTATNGKTWVISTPLGRNFFYTLFCWGNSSDKPEFASHNFKTEDNPHIKKSVIEDARQTLPPDIFRQYYLAEFLEDSAGVFRGVGKCVSGTLSDYVKGQEYYAGIDLAKSVDYTVITILNALGEVVFFDRFNKLSWPVQIERITTTLQRYGNPTCYVDSTGKGDPVYDELSNRGLCVEPYLFTANSKRNLVERLIVDIEHAAIKFPNIPELIHELQVYEYEVKSAGHISYNAPSGFHDDCVISLALANWGYKNKAMPNVLWL